MRGLRSVLPLCLVIAEGCQGPQEKDSTLTRGIARPPGMVSRVAADVLLELHYRIESDVHREKGGEIVAREPAPGKRDVVLHFEEPESNRTLIRVDPGGHGRRFGEQLLDRIAVRVGEETERVPPYIRASAEGSYEGTLDEALAALHVALEQVDASVMDRVVQTWGARVEAYAPDDTLYEIAIVVPDEGPLGVLFAASADSKETADRRAEQVKQEFARALAALR
ncbi:MAG TPA: hypothetical protein VNM14_01595 [Planctomycetota bacterium]|nr:hypothetical protein [Planctomycetota bacterium]